MGDLAVWFTKNYPELPLPEICGRGMRMQHNN